MEKYRIAFIGGVPGVGKTSIAGSIAKARGIDIVLSGDYLREFLRTVRSDSEHNGVLDFSVYDAWQHFGEKNEANIIKGFEAQSELMCTGIASVMERASRNGESLMVESLYINRQLIEIMKRHAVTAAYLFISDPSLHAKRLEERGEYTHFKSPGSRLVAQLGTYRVIMNHSVGMAQQNGIMTFDNLAFEDTRRSWR